ncbi:hypothetical protein [Sciscionella marina]|uniref:hypothetical protein n=1 Tax=Sciscionella marina TaxID=508770 RepID=UPI00037762D9|nr:hypothetical protein [Sciscionella marina]
MTLVLTVLLFTAVVAASVVFVVRTALKARLSEDGEAPDPLDEYVHSARASFAETRASVSRFARGGEDELSAPQVHVHSSSR